MVGVKSPLPTSRVPGLSAWVWGAFLLAAVDRLQLAEGQTSQASCINTSWNWSFNSKNQTPCLVAAYLLAPCGGGQWTVPALPPNQHYINEKPNTCSCSTVVYSLLSACAGCQTGSPPPRWSSWQTNCTNTNTVVSIQKYPHDISPATAVPAWAYLDVVTPDELNLLSAMQLQLPESTVGNTQGVSTSSSASSSPSTTSIGSPSTQSSNTSAIIGGTVGGVLGLGLIVALIIYLVKLDDNKKHRRQAPSAAFAKAAPTPDGAAAAGFRSASRQANPLAAQPFTSGSSVGHGGSNHGHRGASPVFQLGYTNGTPWSPPPPSSTPTGTVSPMSAQSLLSAQNYGGGGRFGSNSFDYPNSSNGHGTVDLLGHSGSLSSMRSTIPMMQYAGTPGPPLETSVPGPYANTRPTHPYGAVYGHGRSGSHRSQFSGLPEI